MSDEIIFPMEPVYLIDGPTASGEALLRCYTEGAGTFKGHKAWTEPFFGDPGSCGPSGCASEGRKFSPYSLAPTSTRITYNVYKANASGTPGSDNGYSNPVGGGQVLFKVSPCIERIKFTVYGRRDRYKSSRDFDTLKIIVDGITIKSYANTQEFDLPSKVNGVYTPALTLYNTVNNEVTEHTFTTASPCGHRVILTGESGNIANNKVGYDVAVECFFRTTPLT